ncbi:hypothetical protein [Streptomyces sp. N50]|uniref:hypothetical protein n=1 Tax=Streptomyces sp. N50 TaxID=3081765 RepID=UPI002962100D|nr:hypothetical protein [Streptomyces sp. N50]WOX08285.1 hypothetical protein R2B38_05065 [Streptomyces sp. N50]
MPNARLTADGVPAGLRLAVGSWRLARQTADCQQTTCRATAPPRHRATAPPRHRATAPPRHRATAPPAWPYTTRAFDSRPQLTEPPLSRRPP